MDDLVVFEDTYPKIQHIFFYCHPHSLPLSI